VASAYLDRTADLTIGDNLRFSEADPVSAADQFTVSRNRLATAVIRPNALS
jgi:hypothetical protein